MATAISKIIPATIARIEAKAKASGSQLSEEPRRSRSDVADLLRKSGAPARHAKKQVDTLRGKVWLAKLTEIASRVGTGFLIALIGDRGPGKTQMGVELIRRCCETGRSARYVTAMDFFIAVKASYGDGADERERAVIQSFARPRLLVFDEVQERGETDWENRLLTHLIDLRYREERDTLLIANLLREPFIESLGPSITSRLIETGGIVECSWPSFREEQEEEI